MRLLNEDDDAPNAKGEQAKLDDDVYQVTLAPNETKCKKDCGRNDSVIVTEDRPGHVD